MSQVHLQFQSFNAGELSPLLGARFAVEKVQSGCRRLRNFYSHVHGPAFRRPGMEYMGPAASDAEKSRLEGFNFSTSTGFILEFAPNGLRVWSNGVSVPLRSGVALPYSAAECFELQMVQVNDVCYIAHPNHAPMKLVRYADDDWRLKEIEWAWPAMGDENVRSEEIATPDVTALLTLDTYQWPEFDVPAGSYSFGTTGTVNTPSGTKTRNLQALIDGTWTTIKTQTWNTSTPPDQTGTLAEDRRLRMTYSGPVLGGGATVRTTWGILGGTYSMPLDVIQPRDDETATVPAAKEWQVIIDCGSSTVPSGAHVNIWKKVGSTWSIIRVLHPASDEVTSWRGPKFAADTDVRLDWSGSEAAGGEIRVEQLDYPPVDSITLEVDATNGTDREMTASEPIFTAGHVGSYWQIAHQRAQAYAQIVADQPTISAESSASVRVSGRWDLFTYGTWSTTLFLEKKIGASWEVMRSWVSKKDRNIIASGTEEQEVELRLRVAAGTAEAATGADVPRFILELTESRVYGLVKVTAVDLTTEEKTDTATVDVLFALHSTDPTEIWTEGAWSVARGFPRAVALYGQRLWFGGTTKESQRLWGSVVADYENFRRSSLDDASVSFVPAAQQANSIQWLAPHEDELVIGTSGNEWTLSPAANGAGIITPVSAQMQRRSAYGSHYLPPLMLGEGLVFLQHGQQKLRQIASHTDSIAWSASDLTVLAEHLMRAKIVQMVAMTFPLTILWAVTADGKLLGMTFESEQNVFGWHVHETAGLVESVAVVHGSETDEVWLQILRDTKRTVERLDPLGFSQSFDQRTRLIYLDAAVRSESMSAQEAISGLDHLEGGTVSILGDGAELDAQTVVGGTVTLSTPSKIAIAGLPFTSELQPMQIDIPLRDGTAQGRKFKVARATVKLHYSLGGEIASSPASRFEKLNYRRVGSEVGQPPPLFTGDIGTALEAQTGEGVDVIVRTDSPLPLNVGSIVAELDVYGS